jgi:hypothetical protein
MHAPVDLGWVCLNMYMYIIYVSYFAIGRCSSFVLQLQYIYSITTLPPSIYIVEF